MSMPSFKCLLLCCISTMILYICPDNGFNVKVPKYLLRIFAAQTLLYVAYKVFFSKSTSKSRFIYFSSTKKMRAQIARKYHTDKLELSEEHPCPKVVHPDDVLVRVCAASFNPIDYRLIAGHGRPIFDRMRRAKQLPYGGDELPLVLGRDCSGIVEDIGNKVGNFRIGDKVYLGINAEDTPGTFADKVLAKEFMVARKPNNISHAEAASIPHVCTTTWGALVGRCGLGPDNTRGKRVLILGGTGGIGSFSIQLIKAWGGHVTTTCSTDGIPLVKRLGADDVIDYTRINLEDALAERPKFDVIFVTIDPRFIEPCSHSLKKGGQLVTVVVPFISNFRKYGMVFGTIVNAGLKIKWILQDLYYSRKTMISFSRPNGGALEEVRKMIEEGKVHPVIQKKFLFEEINQAMDFVKQGHARGKTVILMSQEDAPK